MGDGGYGPGTVGTGAGTVWPDKLTRVELSVTAIGIDDKRGGGRLGDEDMRTTQRDYIHSQAT